MNISLVSILAVLASLTPPEIQRIDPPAGPGSMAPRMTSATGGAILSWLEPLDRGDQGAMRLRFARWSKGRWSAPVTVCTRRDMFVNWADVPSVVESGGGGLLAHWLQKTSAGTYAYAVMLSSSDDGGITWRELGPAHGDGTHTEHGFVSHVRDGDGLRIFWLDGRAMVATEGAAHGQGTMSLRTALVDADVHDGFALDSMTCECCGTAAAMTSDGAIVAYRDLALDQRRDISVTRYNGTEWSDPVRVHDDGWFINGCPVNGPAMVAEGNLVVVAWFTGAQRSQQVHIAFSNDGGSHFQPPVTVDDSACLGRVTLSLLPGGEVIVGWIDIDDEGGRLVLRRVSSGNPTGPRVDVAALALSRSSGFPWVVLDGDHLLVAWTEVLEDDGGSHEMVVRAVRVPVSAVP